MVKIKKIIVIFLLFIFISFNVFSVDTNLNWLPFSFIDEVKRDMILVKESDYPIPEEIVSGYSVPGLFFPDVLSGNIEYSYYTYYGGDITTFGNSTISLPNNSNLNTRFISYMSLDVTKNGDKITRTVETDLLNISYSKRLETLLQTMLDNIKTNQYFKYTKSDDIMKVFNLIQKYTTKYYDVNGNITNTVEGDVTQYANTINVSIDKIEYQPSTNILTYTMLSSPPGLGEYTYPKIEILVNPSDLANSTVVTNTKGFSDLPDYNTYSFLAKHTAIINNNIVIVSDMPFNLQKSSSGLIVNGSGKLRYCEFSGEIPTVFKPAPFPAKSFLEDTMPITSGVPILDSKVFDLDNLDNIQAMEDILILDEDGEIANVKNDDPFKIANINLITPPGIKYDVKLYKSYKFDLINIEELKIFINDRQVLLESFSSPFTGIYEFDQLEELKYMQLNTIKCIAKYQNLEKTIVAEFERLPGDNNSLEGTELPSNNNTDNIFDNLNKIIKSINDTFLKLLDISNGFILLVKNMFMFLPPEILSLVLLGVSLSIILRIFGR